MVSRVVPAIGVTIAPSLASAVDKKSFEYQPALAGLDYGKPRTYYPDFVQKVSGLQYKVVKEGTKEQKLNIDYRDREYLF